MKQCERCWRELDDTEFSLFPDIPGFKERRGERSDVCIDCAKVAVSNVKQIEDVCKLHRDFIITRVFELDDGHRKYISMSMKDISGKEYNINIGFITGSSNSHFTKVNLYKYFNEMKDIGLSLDQVYTRIAYIDKKVEFKFVSIVDYEYTKKYLKEQLIKLMNDTHTTLYDIKCVINNM